MTRRLRRFAVLPGLALAMALVGGLSSFVGTAPAGAADTLTVALAPSSISASNGSTVVSVSGGTVGASVTITVASGGGIVTGTPMTVGSGGTVSGATIAAASEVVGAYLVTATESGANTGSGTATLTEFGPASKIVFSTEPSSSATGGTVFGTQPVVSIEDAGGNVVTTGSLSVTLALAGSPTGVTLTCTSNAPTASAGVATFAGCSINKQGTYLLTATAGTLTVAVSSNIQVNVGPAAQLGFTTEPGGSAALGSAFSVQPVVSIEDAGGNVVASGTNSNASVVLTLTSSPAGATLTCTANTVGASAGTATFAGCEINLTGRYTLTASASGLSSAVSTGITIGGTTAVTITPKSPPRIATGSSAVFAAFVAEVSGTGSLTGSVSYEVNGSAQSGCTNVALSSESAKCTITFSSPDKYQVTATYANDPLFNSSSAQVTQVVVNRVLPKEIDTVHPSGTVKFGSAIQLRIHLYGANGAVAGSATVKFAGKTICPATLTNGVANCTLSSSNIGHGKHILVVLYKGQGLYYSHNQALVITMT